MRRKEGATAPKVPAPSDDRRAVAISGTVRRGRGTERDGSACGEATGKNVMNAAVDTRMCETSSGMQDPGTSVPQ